MLEKAGRDRGFRVPCLNLSYCRDSLAHPESLVSVMTVMQASVRIQLLLVLALVVALGGGRGVVAQGEESGQEWNRVALAGVDVSALVVDPLDQSHLYAWVRGCRGSEAAFKAVHTTVQSTVGDRTWTVDVVGGSFCSSRGGQLTLDSAGVLYAITEKGFGSSTDGGKSWSLAPRDEYRLNDGIVRNRPTGKEALVLFDGDTPAIFVDTGPDRGDEQFTGYGVLRSMDGGASWHRIGPSIGFFPTAIAVDPVSADIVYVSAQFEGVWRTEDGGQSWVRLDDGPRFASPLIVTTGGVYVGGYDKAAGVWRSPDRGRSWTRAMLDLEPLQFAPDRRDPKGAAIVVRGFGTDARSAIAWSPDDGASSVRLRDPVPPQSHLPGGLVTVGDALLLGTRDGIWQTSLPPLPASEKTHYGANLHGVEGVGR